jgi:hypothetical protein
MMTIFKVSKKYFFYCCVALVGRDREGETVRELCKELCARVLRLLKLLNFKSFLPGELTCGWGPSVR